MSRLRRPVVAFGPFDLAREAEVYVKLSPHEMAWCLKQVGFSGVDAPTGLDNIVLGVAIGLAESGGDPEILGVTSSGSSVGNRDHGVWQISGKWHGDKIAAQIQLGGDWRVPVINAKLAKQVFDEALRAGRASGWQPWSTYAKNTTTGKAPYEEYLPAAKIAVTAMWPPSYSTLEIKLMHGRVSDIQSMVDEMPDLEEILAGIKALKVTIG